jgi:hypothetical protein
MMSDFAEASADADKTCLPAAAAQNTISAPTSASNSFSGVLASTAWMDIGSCFLSCPIPVRSFQQPGEHWVVGQFD